MSRCICSLTHMLLRSLLSHYSYTAPFVCRASLTTIRTPSLPRHLRTDCVRSTQYDRSDTCSRLPECDDGTHRVPCLPTTQRDTHQRNETHAEQVMKDECWICAARGACGRDEDEEGRRDHEECEHKSEPTQANVREGACSNASVRWCANAGMRAMGTLVSF